MDRALFDVAHLIADLTYVDGAVLMTDRLELLGFGVEISGGLPERGIPCRARPRFGRDGAGAGANRPGGYTPSLGLTPLPRASGRLVVVVSQDGGLRFVRWHHDAVTYWDRWRRHRSRCRDAAVCKRHISVSRAHL